MGSQDRGCDSSRSRRRPRWRCVWAVGTEQRQRRLLFLTTLATVVPQVYLLLDGPSRTLHGNLHFTLHRMPWRGRCCMSFEPWMACLLTASLVTVVTCLLQVQVCPLVPSQATCHTPACRLVQWLHGPRSPVGNKARQTGPTSPTILLVAQNQKRKRDDGSDEDNTTETKKAHTMEVHVLLTDCLETVLMSSPFFANWYLPGSTP